MASSARGSSRFVICIRKEGYPVSLELRKLYEVLPDETAAACGQMRVIDESGEDYLYPAAYFLPAPLPDAVEQALLDAP